DDRFARTRDDVCDDRLFLDDTRAHAIADAQPRVASQPHRWRVAAAARPEHQTTAIVPRDRALDRGLGRRTLIRATRINVQFPGVTQPAQPAPQLIDGGTALHADEIANLRPFERSRMRTKQVEHRAR